MNDLRLFTDGTETYVATSIAEARRLQFENIGENPEDESAWREQTEPDPMTIALDDGRGDVTQSIANWIKENGPGFLSSTEC